MKKHFILLLAVAAVLSMALSCGHEQQNAEKQSVADSLFDAAFDAGDYERAIVLADSLAKTGDISPFQSAFNQAVCYESLDDLRHAEEVLKPVLDMTPTTPLDTCYYIDCISYQAEEAQSATHLHNRF